MSRVIPKISSGEFELLLTESLCFNPIEGLKISIPTSDDKTGLPGRDITFNFIFKYNQEPSNRDISTSVINNQVDVLINNFGDALISGTLKPLRGSNPYTNVVKNWIEFTRAIKRDEVAGRYTEQTPKDCSHQQQSTFSCQKVDISILSKDVCSHDQETISRGSQHD